MSKPVKRHKPAITRPAKVKSTIRAPKDIAEGSYALYLIGTCMQPVINDGERVLVEPVLPECGELGVFWVKGQEQPSLKWLRIPLDPFCRFAPAPCQLSLSCSRRSIPMKHSVSPPTRSRPRTGSLTCNGTVNG